MNIKQISVFVENKKGKLAEVTKLLTEQEINIRAVSLAETAEFGILRLIVNKPDKCIQTLKANNFIAQLTDVIAVEVEDKIGGLGKILSLFDEADINIEYMYAFIEKKKDNAIVIFRIDDTKKALDALNAKGISIATDEILNTG
jgi:hypothetical protein